MNLKRVLMIATRLAMLAGVVFSGSARALPTVDGFLGAGEYSHSFEAGWYNVHQAAYTKYKAADNLMTTVYWEQDASKSNFWLYVAAPIEAKNMIWGTGFTAAEALSYYQLWCSPSSGTAALDGSNCTHHKDGFTTFSTSKTGYGDMTGSEKVDIGAFTADLAGAADAKLNNISVLDYKDSVDYVIASLGCNTTNCDASTTPMAFEFRFGALTDTQRDGLISYVQTNKLAFHLSPERGFVSAVPEPETYAMLLAGLGLLGFVARRRKQKLAA